MRKLTTAVTTVLVASLAIVSSAFAMDARSIVAAEAKAQGVPVSFAVAIAEQESTFNCGAYNAGSIGLMQIKYRTARSMGYGGSPRGLVDCKTNAHFGVMYLKIALQRAGGNTCGAATLYNVGVYGSPRSSQYCRNVLRKIR